MNYRLRRIQNGKSLKKVPSFAAFGRVRRLVETNFASGVLCALLQQVQPDRGVPEGVGTKMERRTAERSEGRTTVRAELAPAGLASDDRVARGRLSQWYPYYQSRQEGTRFSAPTLTDPPEIRNHHAPTADRISPTDRLTDTTRTQLF
jgi:hypothetical protein